MPRLARRLYWPVMAVLLAACAQAPRPTDPAVASAPGPATVMADWLPLHANPRPGDWAIHARLSSDGLTGVQRRTEVLSVDGDRLVLRRTLGDAQGRVLQVLRLVTTRDGRVRSARTADGDGEALPLQAGERRITRLKRPEPLALVSGRHPVDTILVRRAGDAGGTVYYLGGTVPFAELVSLRTDQRLGTARLNKLLGRIAVPDRPAAGATPAIRDGWVLMHWGRGSR